MSLLNDLIFMCYINSEATEFHRLQPDENKAEVNQVLVREYDFLRRHVNYDKAS